VVKAGDGAPKAVELSRVTRLEHVSPAAVEVADGRRTIQYRGRLTPVLAIEGGGFRTGTQPLLVFADAACSMALAVDEIVDVVEDRLVVELVADRPGLLGTAVIAGRATEVLDVDHYLVRALAEHARRPQALDVRSAA
jgi:two-component system chemotaxis sensor kinase CheA